MVWPGKTPPVSPYIYQALDFQGRAIRATFNYDNGTRALLSATIHRDVGCVYTEVIVGVGVDGSPNSSTRVFDLSGFTGDKAFTSQQIAAVGLHTIDDILSLQITAA